MAKMKKKIKKAKAEPPVSHDRWKLQRSNIDAPWFLEQLRRLDLKQRDIANLLKIDPSAVTRVLSGKRLLALDEAGKLSQAFGVPVDEILAHAGLESSVAKGLRGVHGGSGQVSLTVGAWVDGSLRIHEETPHGAPRALLPAGVGGEGVSVSVARFQTSGSRFESMNGALIYYVRPSSVSIDALGRLSVVMVDGVLFVRVLKRGYVAGRYDLCAMDGSVMEEGVSVSAASSVLWMRF